MAGSHEPALVERATDAVRFVGNGGSGIFTEGHGALFRRGAPVAEWVRHPDGIASRLGDGYDPALVDAHLSAARAALPALRAQIANLRAIRGTTTDMGRPLIDYRKVHYDVASSINDVATELRRLVPDEQRAVPVDVELRRGIAALAQSIESIRTTAYALPSHPTATATVDHRLVADIGERMAAAIERLPAAPKPVGVESTDEFQALLNRLRATDGMRARDAITNVFEYRMFGDSPAVRVRNMGVAMEAYAAHGDYTDRGMVRFKEWLRGFADDVAVVRDGLPPEHASIGGMLDVMEDHARRNGETIVRNAAGAVNVNDPDYIDYADMGRMGAALRTYVQIDDAGLLRPTNVPVPGSELLW